MADTCQGEVVRSFRILFGGNSVAGLPDADLVARVGSREPGVAQTALEVIVRRHGATVLSVCRSILRTSHDVEDAFQASFLVLIKRAGSIRDPGALGSWLYGVAYRVAQRTKAQSWKRCLESDLGDIAGPPMDRLGSDEVTVLHEEVNRLPQKYRAPVVLCYFQGRTGEEAARALGWPVGSVQGRLARAKRLLRNRLERRGLTPAVAVGLLKQQAMCALPESLAAETVERVVGTAVATAGTLAPAVVKLAEGAIQTMFITKAKWLVGLAVCAATIGTASGARSGTATEQEPAAPRQKDEARPPHAGAQRQDSPSPWVELANAQLAILEAQLESRKAGVERAEAQRQLAVAVLARSHRLSQRNPNLIANEEIAKNEAEVNVARALCDTAKADLKEIEIRIDQTKRLLGKPGQLGPWIELMAKGDSVVALEQRVARVEQKIDEMLRLLRRVPTVIEKKPDAPGGDRKP
jgi:RNA polymerase sigma factor (sigma-70 family)